MSDQLNRKRQLLNVDYENEEKKIIKEKKKRYLENEEDDRDKQEDENGESLIKQKISIYLDYKFGSDLLSIFDRWDFEEILSESKMWELRKKCLFIYIMANDCPQRRLHAKTGCVENLYQRVLQYNGIITGAPQGTRKAAGHWKLIFWMSLPPVRNYSSKEFIQELEKKRGWKTKCYTAIDIATKYNLEWKVTKDVTDENSHYYNKDIYEYAIKKTRKKIVEETFFNFCFLSNE